MRKLILPLILSGMLAATPALADWSLDPARSHLAFVSIKANDVAEINTFGDIQGVMDDEGQVKIALMLDSVETLIPIRNERMREMLFETTNYKEAVLTAKVDPAVIAKLAVGDIAQINAEGTLSLHGQTQPMTLSLQAARVAAGTVMVASIKPLIVDAAKFGLTEGVEKLREIAGLASISKAVPVNFVITFVETPTAGQ
ncbi:YceI family protein [Thiobaca trueperi]|uniref:Polyisoprenoid-binding protein YceI n=1 Tax=Thiobaca trueperi TaxID=127458 RepID=A0A4V2V250_9GAMM|nr:YceI family protein [Thiobaca trueperi]TCT23722.1 polyisoprenoid-binding protein YceI [Thiobaca trueperi]